LWTKIFIGRFERLCDLSARKGVGRDEITKSVIDTRNEARRQWKNKKKKQKRNKKKNFHLDSDTNIEEF
jgi:hypothetical protein